MSSLVERLRRYSEDRGLMASFRCALIDNKKHRAWPALSRLGIPVNDTHSALIAGLFATHPQVSNEGNFGDTCKQIERKRGDKRSDDNKLTPTERRFQHLLSAEYGPELQGRLKRMILLAKALGVPVNYGQLDKDIRYWNDKKRNEWATVYWAPGVSSETDEEAL